MGKGDQKTTRGKRKAGSYGKTRPQKSTKKSVAMVEKSETKAKEAQPKTTEEKPKTTRKKKTEE